MKLFHSCRKVAPTWQTRAFPLKTTPIVDFRVASMGIRHRSEIRSKGIQHAPT